MTVCLTDHAIDRVCEYGIDLEMVRGVIDEPVMAGETGDQDCQYATGVLLSHGKREFFTVIWTPDGERRVVVTIYPGPPTHRSSMPSKRRRDSVARRPRYGPRRVDSGA